MRIVVDEHIPFAQEAFSTLGEVVSCGGRAIDATILRNVDALIVRSITSVDSRLLDNTSIKFVATATSGIDHIDRDYLQKAGVDYSHSQGANARSVAEYVLAAILAVTAKSTKPLSTYSCGIVGYGHVGTLVYSLLKQVGIKCCLYDPFLDKKEALPFVSWEEIRQQDIITFHTPLSDDGPYPTHHLINESLMESVIDDCILINAARGGILDTEAMVRAKISKPQLRYIFDVWENEPDISNTLLECSDIATPHIAGYSWDAKAEATRRVYRATCFHFGVEPSWVGPHDKLDRLSKLVPLNYLNEDELRDYVRALHPICQDDATLRNVGRQEGSIGPHFDRLRNTYTPWREYSMVESIV